MNCVGRILLRNRVILTSNIKNVLVYIIIAIFRQIYDDIVYFLKITVFVLLSVFILFLLSLKNIIVR